MNALPTRLGPVEQPANAAQNSVGKVHISYPPCAIIQSRCVGKCTFRNTRLHGNIRFFSFPNNFALRPHSNLTFYDAFIMQIMHTVTRPASICACLHERQPRTNVYLLQTFSCSSLIDAFSERCMCQTYPRDIHMYTSYDNFVFSTHTRARCLTFALLYKPQRPLTSTPHPMQSFFVVLENSAFQALFSCSVCITT